MLLRRSRLRFRCFSRTASGYRTPSHASSQSTRLQVPHDACGVHVEQSIRKLPLLSSTTSTRVILLPTNNLARRSSYRCYATFTDLPANADNSPPPSHQYAPTSQKVEKHAHTADTRRTLIDDEDELYALSSGRLEFMQTPPDDGLYEEEAFDGYEEYAGVHQAPIQSRDAKPQGGIQETTQLKLRAKAPIRKQRIPTVFSKRTQPKQPMKSISESTFEDYRLQHRREQWRLDYQYHPLDDLEVDASTSHTNPRPKSAQPQPQHQSLSCRYDWRLRNPWRTPGERQKHAYGSKVLFRRRASQNDAHESAQLQAYQEKYRRFIEMERKESEAMALARLQASSRWKAYSQPFDSSSGTGTTAEHLIGLSAVPGVKRHRRSFQSVDAEPGSSETGTNLAYELAIDEDDLDKADERDLYHFSLPKRVELPPNQFHRGKMVFIWKCKYDDFLKDWIVPELQDRSLDLQQLSLIPARGYIDKEWSNRLDILCEGFEYKPGEVYRIDLGYDGTSFDRQLLALDKLALDAKNQRKANENSSKGPHLPGRNIEVSGTELRDLLLDEQLENPAMLDQAKASGLSPVLMQDQYIASWASRYAREHPIQMDGDPQLGLNGSQLRAVANAVLSRFSLIQGPPGTGKTATIVAALKLLKVHFQIAAPILVCAHTNVVVDMIVNKCAEEGLRPLRFGREHRVRSDLKEFSCEEQIKTHPLQKTLKHWSDEEDRLRDRKKEIVDILEGKSVVFADIGSEEAKMSSEEMEELRTEAGNVELAAQKAHSTYIKTLRRVHSDLIASSDVCLSTCMSASAWEMGTADFPIVFIDEAGQCDEPTTLVPLMKGSQHAVLIGDHKQLPSVCSSGDARREGLNRSLFERLKLSSSVPSVQLDTQYRMHPHISAFPNKQFYLGSIKDSDERIASMITHTKQPVVFYHHTHAESKSGQSIINDAEADDIVRLLLRLRREQAATGQDEKTIFSNIGIISMYAAQKELIRRKVRDALGDDHAVEIHTVDGFQGRDKDTIVISTARSNNGGFKGFLTDPRRMNVALTRARNQLYVFGNANTLEAFQPWARETPVTAEYINWLRKNDCVRQA